MDLSTILLSILLLNTQACLAGIIIDPSNADQSVIFAKTTAQVLNLCYKKDINVVGIAGNSDGDLIKTLHAHLFFAVTLVGKKYRRISKNGLGLRLPNKLQVFVVTSSSATELEKTLVDIKDSTCWNHLASYFILDSLSGSKDGCSNAFDMLWTAWTMDLLNAKFVCLNRSKDQLIYTYNPYTKLAPDPWTLVNTYKGINNHPWSLFVRRHRENVEICKELDFDQARNLGGYRIYSSGINQTHYCSPTSNITRRNCSDMSYKVIDQIVSGTLGGVLYTRRHGSPIIYANRTNNDVLMEVESGITDILWHSRFRSTVFNYTTTYPFWGSGLSVITQRSPNKSSLSKIHTLFDKSSRFGFYMVFFITLLFFKWFLRQEFMTVILNIIRIIGNISVPKLPANVAPRIYLGSLLIVVLIIQAAYQGNLASLLTIPVPLPNVESIEDLDTMNYTIYGHKTYGRFFKDSDLEKRFIGVEDFNCTQYVLRDSSAACIRGERFLVPEMMRFGLHMSDSEIIELYEVYVIRDDWPIEHRVNLIMSRMSEAGIILYLDSKQSGINRDKHYFFEDSLLEKKFRVITLDNLAFAFVFLGFGLGLATVAFINEVGMVFT